MTVPFEVTKETRDRGVVRLRVVGDIDNDVSETLTALMINAIEQDGVTELEIDLGQACFLAAAGVHCLLDGRGAALRRACGFRVVNAHGIVERVLEITGLTEVLDTEPAPRRAPH